jgi:hypothetical protein
MSLIAKNATMAQTKNHSMKVSNTLTLILSINYTLNIEFYYNRVTRLRGTILAKLEDLQAAALSAIPETGEIEVPTLLQNLRASGNGEAIPMLRELKRDGKIKASLVANEDGSIRHTYSRVEGA